MAQALSLRTSAPGPKTWLSAEGLVLLALLLLVVLAFLWLRALSSWARFVASPPGAML